IRDATVTGVQTCALPISCHRGAVLLGKAGTYLRLLGTAMTGVASHHALAVEIGGINRAHHQDHFARSLLQRRGISESRRVASSQIGRASCRERRLVPRLT